MFEAIFIFGTMIQLAWGCVGLALLANLLLSGRWIPTIVLVGAGAALVLAPLPQWGGWLWFRISFESHKAAYAKVVEEAPGLPRQGTAHGVRYLVEPGPPVRVAFPQPVGVADNWSAVIHDPSDAVLTARGWGAGGAGEYTARPYVQELWGGDLLTCTRITGHWHRCWFT
ncbi:hypothetical protein [Brevundimonas sp. Root1279]|uniref:hypothetical protein n=1 Tax=Brevundimonas sp. Root1279 TaxID=1736443 RepID=UPI0012E3EEB4|nr:hypothetical protein [Brevundimonas sp. Root1279]